MSGSVWNSLGNNTEFGIDENMQFVLRETKNGKIGQSIQLGLATETRLNMLHLHIGRMRIHTQRD